MSCVIWGCKSHSSRKENNEGLLPFHRFPADDDKKKEWLNRIGRRNWTPKRHSHICSKHFTEDSFTCATGNKWRRLREDAMPTLNITDQADEWAMATNRSGAAVRPNGAPQTKVCQFKLVLLGESAVGKSSLVLRFVKGQFHEYQESTIGAAFLTQTVCLDDTTVKFEIWDTAGQERYHSLAPMYYRGAQAAIVVYDITNQDTFGRAKNWVKELQRQASPSIVIALAGNKSDLAAKRMVEFEEAQAYADENGLLFMETSAKTAMNVNDIFLAIANKLPKSEGGGTNPAGGARRLADGEQPRASTCCK